MSVHIEGFEEQASELRDNAESIDGSNEVPMDDLFPSTFMRTHTEFDSIEEFFHASPWNVETQEDFQQLPEDKFDDYVNSHTDFNAWDGMLRAAGREWVARKLSLD